MVYYILLVALSCYVAGMGWMWQCVLGFRMAGIASVELLEDELEEAGYFDLVLF